VVSAYDSKKKEKVAIKKIIDVFDKDLLFSKRILREIKILNHFHHENVKRRNFFKKKIISLFDLQKPKSYKEFKDVYIITDLMDSDLSSIINSGFFLKLKKTGQPLTDEHIQFFLYQILSAMKYIHSADVLHRDLVFFFF
jgi:serine/threonine protein kinase